MPIDPRIRRRRIEVTRDAGRHRLRLVMGCLTMALATAVGAAVSRSPLLDVDYVDVRGAENTARHLIVNAGRLASRPAMLDVDTATVARRVESLPWVLDASARRDWPGTIRIDVTERRPVAVVPAGDGRWASADVTGRVLHVGPDKPVGLPVIGNLAPPGPAGSSLAAKAQAPLRVAAALPEELRDRVADLAIVGRGEVELQLAPPGTIARLGRPVRLDEKLGVLVTLLAGADMAGVRVIDVRVPRAPALTRR